jgi:proline dehydrogenase
MFRRAWQSGMIALACNQTIKKTMQSWSATSQLARRYVGGASPDDAVLETSNLWNQNIRSSQFYLGEYVDTLELVDENVNNKIAVTRALKGTDFDVHVSVDPTQVGFSIDRSMARKNMFQIAEEIKVAAGNRQGVHCLMLDMEDSSVTTPTIEMHDALWSAGLPVAQTLQAYLKRTEADMLAKIRQGSKVRLVRGAFAAGADIAYTSIADIKQNYRKLAQLMLSTEARQSGFYPIFGTHDDALHDDIITYAREAGWPQGSYEFEMLYGARPDVAASLVAKGERVRLYLPFGSDWWPYALRRIGENPRNAYLLGRAVFVRT